MPSFYRPPQQLFVSIHDTWQHAILKSIDHSLEYIHIEYHEQAKENEQIAKEVLTKQIEDDATD